MAIPYLTDEEIREKVEIFREKHCSKYDFPYEIDLIIEKELNIDIKPITELRNGTETLAELQIDLKAIHVDSEIFRYAIDEKFHALCKYRIDLAHEIGHFCLHKHLYETARITNSETWMSYIKSIKASDYNKIEYQAKEFAGRLLVPLDVLNSKLNKHTKNVLKLLKSNKFSIGQVIDYIIEGLPWYFKVSDAVVYKRVIQENIITKWQFD